MILQYFLFIYYSDIHNPTNIMLIQFPFKYLITVPKSRAYHSTSPIIVNINVIACNTTIHGESYWLEFTTCSKRSVAVGSEKNYYKKPSVKSMWSQLIYEVSRFVLDCAQFTRILCVWVYGKMHRTQLLNFEFDEVDCRFIAINNYYGFGSACRAIE